MSDRLRKRIAEVHGVVPLLAFVLFGALPRTSSGKIQRSASRRMLLSDPAPMIKVDAETETAIAALRSSAQSHATHQI